MRRKTTTRPYRNLVGLLAIKTLSILSKAFLLQKSYNIMLFSSRVPERSYRVTSALFLMVRNLMRPQLFSSVLQKQSIFCPIRKFLLFIAHWYFFGPHTLFVAHRYGELVASHPWKAIIACLAITIAGGSGLLRLLEIEET